jgi:hypothetical protein
MQLAAVRAHNPKSGQMQGWNATNSTRSIYLSWGHVATVAGTVGEQASMHHHEVMPECWQSQHGIKAWATHQAEAWLLDRPAILIQLRCAVDGHQGCQGGPC